MLFRVYPDAIAKAERLFNDFVIRDRRLSELPKQNAVRLIWKWSKLSRADAMRLLHRDSWTIPGEAAISDLDESMEIAITRNNVLMGLIIIERYFDNHNSDHLFKLQTLADLLAFVLANCRTKADFRDMTIDKENNVVMKLASHFGAALGIARQNLNLDVEYVAKTMRVDFNKLREWEIGSRRPSFEVLYRWCQTLNLVIPQGESLVQIVNVSPQILALLAQEPKQLHSLSPGAFEQFIAERLDKMGYNVTLTGNLNRKDGGIDIIGVPKANGNYLLAAQVKHHKTGARSSRRDVDRLLSWRGNPFAVGMLVTNTDFTADARWVAEQSYNQAFLRLRDFEDLKKWLANNFSGECREIPDEIEIAPGVVVRIPKPQFYPNQ